MSASWFWPDWQATDPDDAEAQRIAEDCADGERAKVTRLPTQADSEWQRPIDSPPRSGDVMVSGADGTPHLENLEDRPGSIGPGQRSKIMAAVGKLPRDERLARVGELAGRAVESTNDLSYAEAQKVLAGLGEMNKGAGS